MKKNFSSLFLAFCLMFSLGQAQSNSRGPGISLQFNGITGNYVDIGDVFNTLTFPFTFEAWINPSSNPSIWGGLMGSDNDASKYYGFWIRTSSTGTVEVEFGNSFGSGYQYRRGYITTATVPLNTWTHVAVVCGSVTDVHFYFNGVEETKTATDGASTSLALTHSSASASLGGQSNVFGNQMFIGQLDEIRLWNVSRTQDDIRNYMCKKVDPSTAGLIGYWTADESYTSSTVNDNTVPAENGNIIGTVTKLTSAAPIGDDSKYLYTSSWSGNKITLSAPSGDKLTTKMITGSPYGVHVYRVDASPYSNTGLNINPAYYYGVFCAEAGTVAGYKVIYKYKTTNGVITNANESTASLMNRNDGSITSWTDPGATLDTSGNKLSKNNRKTRGEYILNVTAHGKLSDETQSVYSITPLNIFPNPAIGNISVANAGELISIIRITELTGRILKEIKMPQDDETVSVDVSDLKNGNYIIEALTSSGWKTGKFVVQQ